MSDTGDVKMGIANVFRQLTGRKIKENELELLVELQENEYEQFATNLDRTKGWLNTGEFKLGDGDDKALVAANAVVANAIMNADACITKR
jgi:hypothetical protein